MKKLALTLCVVGTGFALAACETTNGDDLNPDDYEAPYADERTVGSDPAPVRARPAPARAERTFSAAQSK